MRSCGKATLRSKFEDTEATYVHRPLRNDKPARAPAWTDRQIVPLQPSIKKLNEHSSMPTTTLSAVTAAFAHLKNAMALQLPAPEKEPRKCTPFWGQEMHPILGGPDKAFSRRTPPKWGGKIGPKMGGQNWLQNLPIYIVPKAKNLGPKVNDKGDAKVPKSSRLFL